MEIFLVTKIYNMEINTRVRRVLPNTCFTIQFLFMLQERFRFHMYTLLKLLAKIADDTAGGGATCRLHRQHSLLYTFQRYLQIQRCQQFQRRQPCQQDQRYQ